MATTTIGPGQTYTTLAAWAAYVNALSLSADEIGRVVGTCSDTARVTVNGWTANGFSVILEASPGTGVNDGGRLWWLSSGRAVLSNSVSYDTAYFFTGTNLIVRNLQIRTTASNSNCVIKQGGGNSIVERCVIQNAGNSFAHDFVSSGGVVRLSLIISGPNSGGVRDGGSGGSGWVRRCTIVSGGGTSTGLQSLYGTLGAQGSAVYGFSTIASGTALSGSGYNAISGTTWGGSGWSGSGQTGLTAADFASTGSGTEDYAPASGSTRLVNTGTAVSGVSADIFGTAVPQGAAADIGAAEYAAAATDTRPPGRRASRRAAPTLPEWAHRHSRKGSRLVVLGAGGGGAMVGTASMAFGAGSSSLTGEGALSAANVMAFGAGSSAINGAGALAGIASMQLGASASLSGAGTLAGTAALAFTNAAELLGAGAISGTAALAFGSGASGMAGAGGLAGTAALAFTNAGALSSLGSGDMFGTCSLALSSTGTMAGAGTMAGTTAATFSLAGALAGSGILAGASALALASAGAMTGNGAMAGAVAAAFSSSGDLTNATAGAMAGASAMTFGSGASALVGAGTLAASVAIVFSPTGTLVNATSGAITGAAAMVLSPAAALLGAGALTAATQIIVGSTATLTDAVPGVFTSNSRQRIGPEAGGVSKQRIGDTTL